MIAFGIKTPLVHFEEKYYNYKGIVEEGNETDNKDNNGLAIGTYQDNGLTIFNGQRTVAQTVCWLYNFQLQVDEVAEGDFFQFTVEVWKPCTANNLPTAEEEEEAIGGISPEEWEKWRGHIT
eukprot:14624100-Ditylum_brightwellii.AAC.1